jgi:hypothetical protein
MTFVSVVRVRSLVIFVVVCVTIVWGGVLLPLEFVVMAFMPMVVVVGIRGIVSGMAVRIFHFGGSECRP